MQRHGLADAHLAQLAFLEVGLDPGALERHHRHQRRARRDALPHLHVAAGDLPGHGCAQLGALQCEVRFAHDRGGALNTGVVLDRDAFGQHPVARRLLACRGDARFGSHQRAAGAGQRRLGVLHLLAAHGARGQQRLAALDVVEPARHLGARALGVGLTQLQRRRQTGIGHVERAHFAHRLRQLGLRTLECQARVGRVEHDQRLPGFDEVGVVGQHRHDRATELRRHLHQRRLHVGVVGAFVVPQVHAPIGAVGHAGQHHDGAHGQQCGLAPRPGHRRRGGRRFGGGAFERGFGGRAGVGTGGHRSALSTRGA